MTAGLFEIIGKISMQILKGLKERDVRVSANNHETFI